MDNIQIYKFIKEAPSPITGDSAVVEFMFCKAVRGELRDHKTLVVHGRLLIGNNFITYNIKTQNSYSNGNFYSFNFSPAVDIIF